MKPIAIPSAILNVNGIRTITNRAGKLSVKSFRSISVIFWIISAPIKIRIGDIAALGMIFITGIKNNETKKSNPVVTAVSPVRPPAVIPAAVSTVETVGLDPNIPHERTERAFALSAVLFFSDCLIDAVCA